MKNWVKDHLRCPACFSPIQVMSFEMQGEEVWSGLITCQNPACNAWYPILRGIPRMTPESLRTQLTHDFVEIYGQQIANQIAPGTSAAAPEADKLHKLKTETIQNFGFEWIEYARFGWDDDVYNIEREGEVFRHKSLLSSQDISGKIVLDAGCGNGRYTYWAAQSAGRVVGIDLGDGVESAADNTKNLDNVQIIQADIFNLPFEEAYFDVIFSIGVLMHTGDAEKATTSLASKLKPNGSLTVHLYGKGNLIYEFVDRTLRNRTTQMSISQLQHFTDNAYKLRRVLDKLHLSKLVNLLVRLDPHPHCIFDWYAAPIATHHTYTEVDKWFDRMGMKVVATNKQYLYEQRNRFVAWLAQIVGAPTVTVRGIKES